MMQRVKAKLLSLMLILSLTVGMVVIVNTQPTYAAAKKIHVKKKTVSIYVGSTYQQKLIDKKGKTIKAAKVKWKSSNKKIAKISKKGKITAVKKGTVKMTAKYKGKTYKFTVKVKAKPVPAPTHNKSISVDPSSLTIEEGESATFTIKTDLGYGLTYYRSNGNVTCTWGNWISETSCTLHVNGVKVGQTTLTIYDSLDSSVYDTVLITVKPSWALALNQATPITVGTYYSSGKPMFTFEIESVIITEGSNKADIEVVGKVLSSNNSSSHAINYRIIDSDGYNVREGLIDTNTSSAGAKFKVSKTIYLDSPKGQYAIEFFDKLY